MDLPERKSLEIEDFKSRWQLTPEQLASSIHTEEELNTMQEFLLMIEEGFREEIADWELENTFFLYQDEESEGGKDYILRFFSFTKGLTECWLVIGCQPQIEVTSENMDVALLGTISNILLSQLNDVLVRD